MCILIERTGTVNSEAGHRMGDGNEAPYDNAAFIAHPREPRLLLLTSEAGWTLPRFGVTEPPAIIHVIRERLGVDTIVLEARV